MANAVFQAADENMFRAATWSGTTPATSYSLTTLRSLNPAARVLFPGSNATITANVASGRGDVLVIPTTNADSLTLTNNNGLSEAISIPAMTRSRIPRTIVADLALLEPSGPTRTATIWNLAFGCSGANLQVGGAIALYTPRTELLVGDFQWGGKESRQVFGVEHENEYGVRYRQLRNTMRRSVSLVKLATAGDLIAIRDWFDNSSGKYGTAFLWPDPAINDGYMGSLQETLEITTLAPTSAGTLYSVAIEFQELSKGQPV